MPLLGRRWFHPDFTAGKVKPTGPLELDLTNYFAQKATVVYTFDVWPWRNLVDHSKHSLSQAGTYPRVFQGEKQAYLQDGLARNLRIYDTNPGADYQSSVYTILSICSPVSFAADMMLFATPSPAIYFYLDLQGGNIAPLVSCGKNVRSSINIVQDSRPKVVTAVVDITNDDGNVYLDGVLGANGKSGTNNFSTSNNWCIGNNFGAQPLDGGISLHYMSPSFFTADEVAELSREPWQIVKSKVSVTYFIPPAAGVGGLSIPIAAYHHLQHNMG